MQKQEQAAWVREGRCALGIELGSTRIKAVLIGPDHAPVAMGAHDWENRLEDGVWTYHLDDVWTGIQDAYADPPQHAGNLRRAARAAGGRGRLGHDARLPAL